MQERTEDRVRERIAEGDRAAQNRIQAAEEEADELLPPPATQSEELRSSAKAEAKRKKDEARTE